MVNYFVCLAFITLSLFVYKIDGNYALSVASFFIFFYAWKVVTNRTSYVNVIPLFFINLIIFFNLAIYYKPDYYHFFRTFTLTFFFFSCYVTSLRKNLNLIEGVNFKQIVQTSAFFILIFEFYQITCGSIFNDYSPWFFLDSQSISTATDIGRFGAANILGYIRPISFFHEPSYLGGVLFILLAIHDIVQKSIFLRSAIVIGILLTLSPLVLFFYLAYEFIPLIYKDKKIIFFILSLSIIPFVFFHQEIYQFLRIYELFAEGTSGYIRFILPYEDTIADLDSSLTGIALGQYTGIINNSLYLFVSYFGVLTIPIFVFYYRRLYSLIFEKIIFFRYVIISLFLFSLNGAAFSFESTFLLLIYNYSILGVYEKD